MRLSIVPEDTVSVLRELMLLRVTFSIGVEFTILGAHTDLAETFRTLVEDSTVLGGLALHVVH